MKKLMHCLSGAAMLIILLLCFAPAAAAQESVIYSGHVEDIGWSATRS